MKNDPIVQEIRENRKAIEARYKDNPREYFTHLQEYQQQYQKRLVRRQPKPQIRAKTA